MKKTILLLLTLITIITIIIVNLAYKKHKSAEFHKKDIETLLKIPSKQFDENQFIPVSSFDSSNNIRKLDKNTNDFVSKIEDSEKHNRNRLYADTSNNNTITNKENEWTNGNDNINNDDRNLNSNDLNLLARLIESEEGNEPFAAKLAAGIVVMNRAREDNETIKEVIFKKGQFDVVKTNNFYISPSEDSLRAAKQVLSGNDNSIVPKTTYFFADLNLCSPEWAKTEKFVVRIGNTWFFNK